jgi:hypothetical protein
MSKTFYHRNIDQTLSLLSRTQFALFFLSTHLWLGAHYCAPLETLSTETAVSLNSPPRGSATHSHNRDSFFVLMSISIGGLCIMPLRNYLLGVLWGKVGFRSLFWALVFLTLVLFLGESTTCALFRLLIFHLLTSIVLHQRISQIHPRTPFAPISPSSLSVNI